MPISDPQPIELSIAQAAAFLGVSVPMVYKYLKDDEYPPPRTVDKKFRSDELGQWLREKITRENTIRNAPDTLNAAFEAARKNKEQADKIELENKVRRGELVEASAVSIGWISIMMKIKTRLLGIPTSIAPLVAPEDEVAVVQSILDDAVREALEELSNVSDS